MTEAVVVNLLNFHEVRLDSGIEENSSGGPVFLTTITPLAEGDEMRNVVMALEQGRWQVGYDVQDVNDLNRLRNFFYARRGRYYGFRFKDLMDYQVTNGFQFITDGSRLSFQAIKRYQDSGATYDRRLLKLVSGSVTVYDNATPTSDVSLDLNTGHFTLGATTAATTGHTITATFQFDVPVRFDVDNQDVRIRSDNVMDWQNLPIVEIKF